MRNHHVFYDLKGRRWHHFKRGVQIAGGVLSIIFGVLCLSVLINPVLPSLGLPPVRSLPQAHHLGPPRPKPILEEKERRFQQARLQLGRYLRQKQPGAKAKAAPRSPSRTEWIGFYVNWDDTSFSSLKQNIARLDKIIPEWLHLNDSEGRISADDPEKEETARSFIHEHRSDLRIVPLVNNFNSATMEWEGAKLAALLANPAARTRAISQLLIEVRTRGYAGISIDFENVPKKGQTNLTAFMVELYSAFHPVGLEVSQSVPLDDGTFDYRTLSTFNDYLILMAYDEHAGENKPGPVASHSWYVQGLRRRFSELPPDKFVIAVGNYGYDWKQKARHASEISFQEALRISQDSDGRIALDAAALNPFFDYHDENEVLHHVWFLDAVTAFNQLVEGERFAPRGFALWRLGSEDPSIWSVSSHRADLDRAAAEPLRTIHYGYDLDYEGQGEVLKVTNTPADGVRDINYDERSGLITSQVVKSYPSAYTITRWGGTKLKRIALTFDDGPDEQYTPGVLDVLARFKVSATFFVIGVNAELHSLLLQRIVQEGHELGNHTFTHPNIAVISEEQLGLEINATERLFESRLGRRSLLFRPPYAEDVEPETPDQVKPLLFTSNLGYYTIGMQIDPSDWRNPGVDAIVKRVRDAAQQGEGNVVLLHDSGGDRSQTLAALPLIIQELRADGFEFVAISDLIGLKRDDLMPPIFQSEKMMARVNETAFLLVGGSSYMIHFLFLLGIVLGVMRLVFVGSLAGRQHWIAQRRLYEPDSDPMVTAIVPAYNEEKVICRTIKSLLASDYSNFEVVVVNDGSSDATYERVVETFGREPHVRILTKPNGGKAKALNFGIHQSRADIVVALDADTLFQSDAIRNMVRHFADPRVAAVAGNTKVGNRLNVLTRWQALEYITSQNLDRRAFELLNCIAVVPGAIGAWRRDLLLKAGGFSEDTLAEDADVTLSILRMGYRINYEDDAVALTEAPDTVRGFLKQRFRWMYGTLQAAWKHRDTLFRPRFGTLGLVALPNILIFQILFPLISPVMDFLMLWSVAATGLRLYQHPLDQADTGFGRVLFYYAFFLLLDFGTASYAFLLERKEDWRLLSWLFWQRFLYRQLMYYVAIKSTITALKGSHVLWGKLDRKATVQ